MTVREDMAEHLAHAVHQVEAAHRLAVQHASTLTAEDVAHLAELLRAVAVAAENVRDGRDVLNLDRDGARAWGLPRGVPELLADALVRLRGAGGDWRAVDVTPEIVLRLALRRGLDSIVEETTTDSERELIRALGVG